MSINTFSIEGMPTDREQVNEDLASRYEKEDSPDRRKPYEERIKEVMLSTMKIEAELVSKLDQSLTEFGFKIDEHVSVDPDDFLNIILSHKDLLNLPQGEEAKYKYWIDNDFSVNFNERTN